MEREFETDDLALTAWLMMRGVRMIRYRAGYGKMVWYFEEGAGEHGMSRCETEQTLFLNSECKRFDSFCRDIKKMLRKNKDESGA